MAGLGGNVAIHCRDHKTAMHHLYQLEATCIEWGFEKYRVNKKYNRVDVNSGQVICTLSPKDIYGIRVEKIYFDEIYAVDEDTLMEYSARIDNLSVNQL